MPVSGKVSVYWVGVINTNKALFVIQIGLSKHHLIIILPPNGSGLINKTGTPTF